ncbi:hypothetical protein M569_00990, partial [Genlisea aurea]
MEKMRQWSAEPAGASPARVQHGRSSSVSSISNIKRTQNYAAKAAAQRLAQVMASQSAADNDEDDDDEYDADDYSLLRFKPPLPLSLSSASRPPVNKISGANNAIAGIKPPIPSPKIDRSTSDTVLQLQQEEIPPSRSTSTGKSSTSIKTASSLPPFRPPFKTPAPIPPTTDPPNRRQREKKFSQDSAGSRASSALRDELDILQEENESILEKLRLTEESCEAAEARVKELEKQVATLGEGVTLEAKLLSRKEAALRRREAALREEAKVAKDGTDVEMESLRSDLKTAKKEAAAVYEHLHGTKSEVKALRSEEVVLKRCWLARYWGLAMELGICEDIAVSKYEYWSSLAPLPVEVVLSAGQKAKEECRKKGYRIADDFSDHLTGEGNIESMLKVEMGLKELVSLKV